MTPSTFRAAALLLALVATAPARAADPAPAPGAPPPPAPPASVVQSAPSGVVRATLPNGLRVVVVPDHLAPIVTTELAYLVGSNDAPEGFPGTAHALEHMMFRGSQGLDRDQLFELSSGIGGAYNAFTTENVTQYNYTVSATDLPLVLRIEALRMTGATLAQADWEQERGAIEQEVSRDLSMPIYVFFQQVQAALFAGTPYENDALGTRPSFDKTDAALLRRFYEQWYSPNNAILVIAGDVDGPTALAQAQAAFGNIPARGNPTHAPFTLAPVVPRTLELPTDLPIGLVGLTFRMPGLASRDFAAADILGDVLASQRGALYALVPQGRALSTEFEYSPKKDVGIGLAFAAFPVGTDPAPLLADLRRIFADARNGAIPPELVEAAKKQELAKLAFDNDSISGLARTWARALAVRGVDSPDELAQAYAAVTVDDVVRLARTLLDQDHAVTAILTPAGAGRVVAGSGFGGAESFATPPDHVVTLPDWATQALAEVHPAVLPEAPTVTVLPNGLRLIVQPEHVSHTVSVYGRIREVTETQEPPGKEGVAALVRTLFDYGTETRDRLEYAKAMDDIAAQQTVGRSFSLKVLTRYFEPGMALLAENELHPAFPADEFEIVRGQSAQSKAGELRSPEYLFGRAVVRALVPADDPALRQSTPQSLQSITREDLLAYYKAAFRPDLATIVVVGDVSAEDARRVVEATFGGWQGTGPKPAIDLPPVPVNQPSETRVPDAGALQDRVTLAQVVTVPVDSPDRYTLILGNTVLGGGFSSRLYRDLRVRTGYVYSVSSSVSWSRTRARYSVSFGADPDKVAAARALVVSNLRDLQTTPISDAELARAKAQIVRQLPMNQASIAAIANQYLILDELGLPLENVRTAPGKYAAITAAQIQRAFAAYIHPEDLVQVTRGPAP